MTAARVAPVAGLLLLWVLLNGSVSAGTVLGGVLVALAALAAARVPPVPLRVRPAPLSLLRAVGAFAGDLVRSSVEVAVAAVRSGPRTRSAVVELTLDPHVTDAVLTLLATRISLTPGTLVLEVDRPRSVLYVYVLPARDAADAERRRDEAERAVHRLFRALGSPTTGSEGTT